jgi:hemerythrin
MFFNWKDDYSIGIDVIDKQHRHLLEIGSRIMDLADAKDGFDHYDEIIEVLQELKEYTAYHFKFEEELMLRFGYEDYDTHKFEHYFVIKKIQKFEKEDLEEKQNEMILKLAEFISDWIANHILHEDMKYKDFFISKGVK